MSRRRSRQPRRSLTSPTPTRLRSRDSGKSAAHANPAHPGPVPSPEGAPGRPGTTGLSEEDAERLGQRLQRLSDAACRARPAPTPCGNASSHRRRRSSPATQGPAPARATDMKVGGGGREGSELGLGGTAAASTGSVTRQGAGASRHASLAPPLAPPLRAGGRSLGRAIGKLENTQVWFRLPISKPKLKLNCPGARGESGWHSLWPSSNH